MFPCDLLACLLGIGISTWYTIPPKKKAHKVRYVDEVAATKYGLRQCQERERFVTPVGGEIDEVVDRIYARITRSVQGGERR